MPQKMQIIGFSHSSGTARESGNPYEMLQIDVLQEREARNSQNRRQVVGGYEVLTFNAAPEVKSQLMQLKQFPATVQAETVHRQTQNGVSVQLVSVQAA